MYDRTPYHDPFDFSGRAQSMLDRALRLGKRMALAFALAVAAAIVTAAVAVDNLFGQLFIIALVTFAAWLPILFGILWIERMFGRRKRPAAAAATVDVAASPVAEAYWRRLTRAAPHERERIEGLRRSVERSRQRLGEARLDPDAHDLCVLIDRRLPELIDRGLDALPPDDRGRRNEVGKLLDLVDQFARHCGQGRNADAGSEREAEILRRRFEQRLAPPPFD
jgi:hypothetical protein